MPSATLNQDRADQHIPAPVPPRRRRTAMVVVSALVVLAVGIGAAVAMTNRPAPAVTAEPSATTAAGPAASAPATPVPRPPSRSAQPTGQATANKPPVLPDGRHNAFIRRIDLRRDLIVVDVVQVFEDDAAVKAAIEDGRPRDYAQYLGVYVRNQNRRLRTLALADKPEVDLLVPCGDEPTKTAVLSKLAENAASGSYYYTLSVRDGAVWRIVEHLSVNAC